MSATTFVFLFAAVCLVGEVAHGAIARKPSSDMIPRPEFSDLSDSDYTLLKDHDAFYKFHKIERKFSDALFICKAEGADLYYPKSDLEWHSVKQLMPNSTTYYNIDFDVGIWSGRAWKDIPRGDFVGALLPSNVSASEGCNLLRLNQIFQVIECDKKQAFVCRRDKKPENNETTPASQSFTDIIALDQVSDVSDMDYRFLDDQKAYYKFHRIERKFADAVLICKAEGADLYYPKSDLEWYSVKQLMPNSTTYYNIDFDVGIWSGRAWKDIPRGDFVGALLPSNVSASEGCNLLRLNQIFQVIECDKKQAFVCRRDEKPKNNETTPASQSFTDIISLDQVSDLSDMDYRFLDDQKAYYKFHRIERKFADAVLICKGEGAELYDPKPSLDWFSVIHLIPNNFTTNNFMGIWTTHNHYGEPIEDFVKTLEEPEDVTTPRKCNLMKLDRTNWSIDCFKKQAFICRRDNEPEYYETTTTSQLSSDVKLLRVTDLSRLDYNFFNDRKVFYKFHSIERKFLDAVYICRAEGAELYFARDGQMAEWQDFINLIPKNTTKGVLVKNQRGQTDEDMEPMITAPDSCTFMNLDATFSSIDCEKKAAYICQVDEKNFHIKSV